MRFTVITINLNGERFLKEALASVALQEGEYEHLFWDGGSHDRSLKIARTFPHLQILEGQDQGISDAMNQAASHAQGDFLLYLHADDRLEPLALKKMARALNLHPEISWLYGQAHKIDAEGFRLHTSPYEPFSKRRLLTYNFFTHPATLVARSLFHQLGGFDPSLRYCMDYDLWIRLALADHTPLPLATPLASFRAHSHSLSTSQPWAVTDEAYQVRCRYVSSWVQRWRSYRSWQRRRRFNRA